MKRHRREARWIQRPGRHRGRHSALDLEFKNPRQSFARVAHDLTHIRCSCVWKGRLRQESNKSGLDSWVTVGNSLTKFESERKQMGSSQSRPARMQAEIWIWALEKIWTRCGNSSRVNSPRDPRALDGDQKVFQGLRNRHRLKRLTRTAEKENSSIWNARYWLFPGERIRLALYYFQQ